MARAVSDSGAGEPGAGELGAEQVGGGEIGVVEPDIQIVTAWLLYMIWQGRYDTTQRAQLKGVDKSKDEHGGSKFSLKGVDVRKRKASLWAGEQVLRGLFHTFAKAMGLYRQALSLDPENFSLAAELAQLYTEWEKPDQAAAWQQKLDEYKNREKNEP